MGLADVECSCPAGGRSWHPRVFGTESAARHGPSIFSALPFPGGKTAGSRWLSAATPPERVSKTSASRRDAGLPGDWPPRPAPGCHPIRDGSFREFSGDVAALNPRLPAVKPPASITRKPTGLVKNGFLSAASSMPNTLGWHPDPDRSPSKVPHPRRVAWRATGFRESGASGASPGIPPRPPDSAAGSGLWWRDFPPHAGWCPDP